MTAVGDKAYVLGGSPSCPKGDIECYKVCGALSPLIFRCCEA